MEVADVHHLARAQTPTPPPPSDEKQANLNHPLVVHDAPVRRRSVQRPRVHVPSDPDGERRVRRTIEDGASRNSDLLAVLGDTEYAISATQNLERKLAILAAEIKTQEEAVLRLSSASQAENDRRRSYKNAIGRLRKLYYALTGMRRKFDERAMEAEQAYFQALREQAQEEGREGALKHDLEGIEQESRDLSVTVEQHAAAHKALDKLYDSIFAGPTPGFPDEDDQENTHKRRKETYKQATQKLVNLVTARKKAQQIGRAITLGGDQSAAAIEVVEEPIFSYNVVLVRMDRCAEYLKHGLQLCDEVVQSLHGPVDAKFRDVHRSMCQKVRTAYESALHAKTSDGFNIRTGVAEIIDKVSVDLELASTAQKEILAILRHMEESAREALKETTRTFEDARQALDEIRQAAFESTVGYGAAAPSYRECCDRAATFEGDAHAECDRIVIPTVDETVQLPPLPSYDEYPGPSPTYEEYPGSRRGNHRG
jgi:adenylate kinase family enzyme